MNNSFDSRGIMPYGATPDDIQLAHLALGKKTFFTFGVNTFSDREWGDGTEEEKLFAPTDPDIRSWIRAVKEAGFKLAILTAKHHDGFCLWQSAYTEHCMKNSPYQDGKGDIVREFTDACHAEGILAGVYISPWDRHSPLWGKDEYSDFYKAQLTELMTNYGKIDEVWWDGAGSAETVYRWSEWVEVVRRYQPTAGIFGSLGAAPYVSFRWVGNESGFAGETHYASIDPRYMQRETPAVLNVGIRGAERYVPAEVDVSIRPGWFWHGDQDDKVKTPEELDQIWFRSVGRNAMMLLNFPPDRRGKLPESDVKNAMESHRHISEMLGTDLAKGAKITADSVRGEGFGAENLLSPDRAVFFAPREDRHTATLDLFPAADRPMNMLTLCETVELGERITSFRVENVIGERCETLAEGTSVGYRRAILLPTGNYRHLRVTIDATDTFPILSSLSLHFYPYATKI